MLALIKSKLFLLSRHYSSDARLGSRGLVHDPRQCILVDEPRCPPSREALRAPLDTLLRGSLSVYNNICFSPNVVPELRCEATRPLRSRLHLPPKA